MYLRNSAIDQCLEARDAEIRVSGKRRRCGGSGYQPLLTSAQGLGLDNSPVSGRGPGSRHTAPARAPLNRTSTREDKHIPSAF